MNVQINFTPMAFQLYTGRIGIVSDDPVTETVYVNLRGQGVYGTPVLSPSAGSYNFGDVRINCVKDWMLRIVNQGFPALMIDTAIFNDYRFFVGRTNFPIILNCLETTYVQVITRPDVAGSYVGSILLYNNGTPNPYNINFIANCYGNVTVGGQMLWSYDYPDNVICVAPISDITNDSILDVAAEVYGTNMYGEKHLRAFWANSAGSGVSRWAIGDTSFTGSWGDDCLIAGADYNNDGVRDILLGTAWGDRSVYAINARTGQIIWQYDTHTYDGEGGWVYSVKPMPDVTGDSIGDVICGVGGNELPGGGPRCVYCLNGATGNVVWQCRVQDGIGSVDWTPDINGDYVPDVLAGAWGNSLDKKVYCISGLNGSVLWSHQCTQDVQSVIVIPDINGDFKREVICGDWSGTVKCLSGINGSPLWTTSVGGWVVKLVAIPNLVSLNRPGIAVANVSGVTTFRVLDCTNGNVMWSYPIGGNIWTADAISDLNNDGKQEVLTGNQAGMVYCFNGANGTPLWSYNAGRLIYSIRAINDISFDGNPDVLVGTQASSSTNVASLIAICSGSYLPGVQEQSFNAISRVSIYPRVSRTGFNIKWGSLAIDKISIFDAMGRLIKDYDKPSRYATQIVWNAKDKNGKAVSHGIYFVKVEAKDFSEITKIIVVE
jgi:outer membrane protein assembly factor BamB